MQTLIRVAEIWVPDADGYLLEFGGGVYDHAPQFGAISRSMCFGRGEGLPGRVWEEGAPVLLKSLEGGFFQRAAAAKDAGLSGALAFPVYLGETLKGVVVLFTGAGEAQSGAIEVWRNEPRVTADLRLLDGLYGSKDAAFESASRDTLLARGTGLPGMAWQSQTSIYSSGLADSPKFVRSESAASTGMRNGLAFPCATPGDSIYVVDFLSAPETPIAKCFESWVAGSDDMSLRRSNGHAEGTGPLSVEDRKVGEVHPAVAAAFASGVPQAGPGSVIAWPLVTEGVVSEAIAMTL